MILAGAMLATAPKARAVHFDGVNDWLARVTSLDGVVDGTDGTLSLWFKVDGNPGVFQGLFEISPVPASLSTRLNFELSPTPLQCFMAALDATQEQVFSLSGGTTVTTGVWHHIVASWNASTAVLYLDGALNQSSTPTGASIEYSQVDLAIGARQTTGGQKFAGDMAEVWFDPTHFDLSIESNRLKFRKGNGKPAALGSQGQRPTGTPPAVYLRGPAASFHVNSGSGGAYTVNGTLTDSTTSPSD